MEFHLNWLICMVAGYLIGSIETAVIISNLKYKDDVRHYGSGNAGTTNMLRVFGVRSGVITFVGDLAKGIIAVVLGRLIGGETGGYIFGFFAVIGHDFPVFFGFKGGKGVAVTAAIAWMINPLFAAIGTAAGLVIICISQMVSLGSLVGIAVFMVLNLMFSSGDIPMAVLCVLLWVIVMLRHIDNLKRIAKGEESKLSFFKRKGGGDSDKTV